MIELEARLAELTRSAGLRPRGASGEDEGPASDPAPAPSALQARAA